MRIGLLNTETGELVVWENDLGPLQGIFFNGKYYSRGSTKLLKFVNAQIRSIRGTQDSSESEN